MILRVSMSRSKKCSSKSGKLSENSSRKIMSWILRGKSFLRIEERARSRSEGFELHLWRREPPCWKSSMRDSQSCGERGFWDMVCSVVGFSKWDQTSSIYSCVCM